MVLYLWDLLYLRDGRDWFSLFAAERNDLRGIPMRDFGGKMLHPCYGPV